MKQSQDPNLADNVGVVTRVNGKTRWFNVPWMAYDPTAGREFIHGTTNERTAHVLELAPGKNRVQKNKNITAAAAGAPSAQVCTRFRAAPILNFAEPACSPLRM